MANLQDKDPRPVTPLLAAKSVQEQLQELELAELLEKKALADEAKEQKRAAQLAGIEAHRVKMAKELADQAACPHKNAYGGTLLVGQKLHSNKYLYLCQACRKTWIGDSVPLDLRVNVEKVGGPSW